MNLQAVRRTCSARRCQHGSERRVVAGSRSPGSYPKDVHAALIVGATNCRKTAYVLDLLEGEYRGVFENIILCPSVRYNKTYQGRPWLWRSTELPRVFIHNPGGRLNDYLKAFYKHCRGGEDSLHNRRLLRPGGNEEKT